MPTSDPVVCDLQKLLTLGEQLIAHLHSSQAQEALQLSEQRDLLLRRLPFERLKVGMSAEQQELFGALQQQDSEIRSLAAKSKDQVFSQVQELQHNRQGIKAYRDVIKSGR